MGNAATVVCIPTPKPVPFDNSSWDNGGLSQPSLNGEGTSHGFPRASCCGVSNGMLPGTVLDGANVLIMLNRSGSRVSSAFARLDVKV